MNAFKDHQHARPTSPRFAKWCQGRTLTRRGVLWLGLKCNIRCKFCYDEKLDAKSKAWVNPDKLKSTLHTFRFSYENEFVDFMGGEPTLHPNILEIIEYSRDIGILPTCITHAMHLADRNVVADFKRAGIHDFLVSVHAIGDRLDAIHGNGKESFRKQLAALHAIGDAGIPIRFNVTMIRDNIDQLSEIARLCGDVGGSVINFLTYNPYFEWANVSEIPFQARHSEIATHLKEAIDTCNSLGIEANVRYMPICLMIGYEKHMYTGYQLPYDTHEWDYNSWYSQSGTREKEDWYLTASDAQRQRHSYTHTQVCNTCAIKSICDGLHSQYYGRWGDGELQPYIGDKITNPRIFIDEQFKLEYEYIDPPIKVQSTQKFPESRLTQFDANSNNRAGIRQETNL